MQYLVSKENIVSVVRTGIAYLYAWLIVQIPVVQDWLMSLNINEEVVVTGAAVLFGTLIYQAIRWAAEKWGWLGYLLVFNTKPEYTDI